MALSGSHAIWARDILICQWSSFGHVINSRCHQRRHRRSPQTMPIRVAHWAGKKAPSPSWDWEAIHSWDPKQTNHCILWAYSIKATLPLLVIYEDSMRWFNLEHISKLFASLGDGCTTHDILKQLNIIEDPKFCSNFWCSFERHLDVHSPLSSHRPFLPRDEFGSGFVGIKCFCMATFLSVARKLQHLRQIWIHIWNPH